MKKLLLFLVVCITLLIIVISLFNKESFKNFEVFKISIYNLEYSKNDFYLFKEEDFKEILESKSIIKVVEDKNTINEVKKIILDGREGDFDYLLIDTLKPINLSSTPNYLLELEDFNNNIIYMFMWLYNSQENAFITYFEDNDLNTEDRDKRINLVINENDTKSLRNLIKR